MASVSQCSAWRGRNIVVPESIWDQPAITYEGGVWRDSAGCVYTQLWQTFPALEPFYAEAEKHFHALPWVTFAAKYFPVAIGICAAYLALCFVGQRLMASRPAYDLRGALIAWNALLAAFSFVGFVRTAPHLLYYAWSNGFYESVCKPAEPSYGHGAVGLWTMLFIFSKVPELFDTAFIVLRKKPLIFLHWYHHVTVLLYCWHSYATRSSAGLYFVAMNFGVHALMYFYYALAAAHIRVSWAGVVTTLQISQMFVGVVVCAAVYYFESQGRFCDITPENYTAGVPRRHHSMLAGLVMYASYFALFVIFAAERYIWPAPRKAAAGGAPALSGGKGKGGASSTRAKAA